MAKNWFDLVGWNHFCCTVRWASSSSTGSVWWSCCLDGEATVGLGVDGVARQRPNKRYRRHHFHSHCHYLGNTPHRRGHATLTGVYFHHHHFHWEATMLVVAVGVVWSWWLPATMRMLVFEDSDFEPLHRHSRKPPVGVTVCVVDWMHHKETTLFATNWT